MNLRNHNPHSKRSVALVITLLMLSVITFLAVAFLAMTSRNKSAVSATADITGARMMADAAFARAQAQIIAQMMASNDILSYDYMASHNYIAPGGFNPNEQEVYDPANVNYAYISNNPNQAWNAGVGPPYGEEWAQNIANLFYDPRPPVFVMTNANFPNNLDFRYWVDVNRNGQFESNGYVADMTNVLGSKIPIQSGYSDLVNGEPEWIGVLKYPETNHSLNNPFIGRYAFMVLPIGKTLDWNYIHNASKYGYDSAPATLFDSDSFIRDQGVGSWEMNLAAYLYAINHWMYMGGALTPYSYSTSLSSYNTGYAFNDASSILGFRYGYNAAYPQLLNTALGYPVAGDLQNIDEFGISPSQSNYIGNPLNNKYTYWPGTYNSNMFYDVQDLFNSGKTGEFAYNISNAMSQPDTTNRYTFQRMLASIGTGSSPEYATYVYPNFQTTNPTNIPTRSILRTKVNINYDNTAQIQAGPYNASGGYNLMPTTLLPWSAANAGGLNFFTNAAESLLRSQIFVYTNYVQQGLGGPLIQSNYLFMSFGLTNIPVYNQTQPGVRYNEQVHRMLQLAANIYAAAYPTFLPSSGGASYPPVQIPPVFRPMCQFTNIGTAANPTNVVYIIGYQNVNQNSTFNPYNQILGGGSAFPPWKDLTDTTIGPTDNVWGVPWVVGAVKGNPQFDQFSYAHQVNLQPILLFCRYPLNNGLFQTNARPEYTNIYNVWQITGSCGMDAWNPYGATNRFYAASNKLTILASNYTVVTFTNNATNANKWGTNYYISSSTNLVLTTPWSGQKYLKLLTSNYMNLSNGYLCENPTSPNYKRYITFPLNAPSNFWGTDTNQRTYPTHYWSLLVTNHLYYALIDGTSSGGNVLDFVTLGPFGSACPITSNLIASNNLSANPNPWLVGNATDAGSAVISTGLYNQIATDVEQLSANQPNQFFFSLVGSGLGYADTVGQFGPPIPNNGVGGTQTALNQISYPYEVYLDSNSWLASDPLVHYTVGDLTSIAPATRSHLNATNNYHASTNYSTLGLGTNMRYKISSANGGNSGYMLFSDPGITAPDNWQFPTNPFPSIGWLGRVHRGTPWQTIYLKANDPSTTDQNNWNYAPNGNYPWINPVVNNQTTYYPGMINYPLIMNYINYPTNDWALLDLFTTAPNDNAARGLLSVNQTNTAAWHAVLDGVPVLTQNGSPPSWTVIDPSYTNYANFYYNAFDAPVSGLNAIRATNLDGVFHHVGEILKAPELTVASPYLPVVQSNGYLNNSLLSDEMVERIPQQTLGLLKLGMPQFVIYSWGQTLKPKNIYSGVPPELTDICTNYEITGEFMTRAVCHVVSDPGAIAPKIVVDNFNIEPGN